MSLKHAAVLSLVLGALLVCDAGAADRPARVRVYIGTYTGGASEGIYLTHLDLATGRLEPVELAAPTANPSFLAWHPRRPLLNRKWGQSALCH